MKERSKAMSTKEENLSPCTRVCKLDESDRCIGCFRTKDEIKQWNNYSIAKKQEVLAFLEERKGAFSINA